jgi:hypothetical protein
MGKHDAVAVEGGSSIAQEEQIRAALGRILESPEFRASKRSQDFLRFVVVQSLLGRAAELKERTVGVEAFGRAASYDTNEDGVVRIKASEVRRRLNAYYTGSGQAEEVRIELPVGGYAPHFSRSVAEVGMPAAITAGTVSAKAGKPVRQWKWIVAGAFAAALGLLAWTVQARGHSSVLDQFWAPVLGSPAPVLIAAAYVPAYNQLGPARVTATLQQGDAASDYVLLKDHYVGGGDLVAATRVAGLLSRLNRPYVVKVGTIAFEDMRNAPTVMIGYSSDQWSAVSSQLRFYIDDDRGYITDNGKPTPWYPHALDRRFHTDEDYAIVSRVFDKQTHAMLVVVTGITQYGTEAAGEVVTDADLLAEALRGAPGSWRTTNLQLVLHMNVISNYPASPKVVASYFW